MAVAPRRLTINGKAVHARITSQFVVDPEFRGFAGVKLLSAVLAGPQDICIADESNADSRILWERLGGVTSPLYSMRWIYPALPVCAVCHTQEDVVARYCFGGVDAPGADTGRPGGADTEISRLPIGAASLR